MKWTPGLTALAIAYSSLVYGQAISAARVLADIQTRGAQAEVTRLTAGNSSQWEEVMRQIETGTPEWLQVATALRRGSDAGNTESLYYAVSYALLRAPQRVLPMIGGDFPLQNVCTVPDIEPSPEKVRRQVAKARTALRGVTDPGLQSVRNRCLSAYESLESR
jgi:hypothetical protein